MATLIPCEVDTTPMADEIQRVSRHVDGTTAAVVTMQSAVIAAEKDSADKVCSNVNRGFFTLMRSQISQKIANKQSRVEALLMHMGQQKRQLLGIKSNMEREYGRIAARYQRIFTSINKELEQRIRQIDQPVFELVNKHMVTSSNRMNALSAWAVTTQAEGLTHSQQILMSRMKHDAQVVLEQSADFLSQIGNQRVLTSKVLINNPMGNENKICQVPVMICETVSDSMGIPRTEVVMTQSLSPTNTSLINSTIREADNLPCHEEEVSQVVTEEFLGILESANVSARVKEKIKEMYSSSHFETL